jgi:hypothetical protein
MRRILRNIKIFRGGSYVQRLYGTLEANGNYDAVMEVLEE